MSIKKTQYEKHFKRYSSERQIRHPLQLFQEMFRDLLASRTLAGRLLMRDLTVQYRQSFLGIIWAFIPPVVTAVGFTLAKNSGVMNISNTEIPYPAYVLFSTALWQTFLEALNAPISGVNTAKTLLSRIKIPPETIVLAKSGQVLFNFAVKLILIIITFIWFRVPVTWTVVLAPVALIHLVILGTAIGLLLAPWGTLYGDISRIIPLISAPWLLLTPVIYPVPKSGWFGTLVNLNPVTPLLVTTRELATGQAISEPTAFWVVSGIAIVGLLVGWIIYRLSLPFVIERISS